MKIVYKTAMLAGAAWSAMAGLAIAAPAPAADPNTVTEVTVTARRISESEQKTPVAVTAFTQRQLDKTGVTDVTGLQGAVPNLNIVQGRGSADATNIFIRGVGQPDALQTFDPAVGVYIDDVYYSRIRGTKFDLLDLSDAEVLRGPQGTLYGKNTIGGALKLTTRKPGQEAYVFGEASIGSYDQHDFKISASGPISDTFAIGISALSDQHAGYVHDPINPDRRYNNENTKAVRGQIAWTPNSNFRLDLSADYTRETPNMTVGQAQNTLTSAFGAVLFTVPNPVPTFDFKTSTTSNLPNKEPLEHWGMAANATWNLSEHWTLKSITSYRHLKYNDFIDIDATPVQLGDVQVEVGQNQTSQEFQLNYQAERLSVVSGVYYLRENVESFQQAFANAFLTPFTFLRTINDDLHTTSWAAYVNANYALTDKLHVSAGLRYTDESKDYVRSTTTFSSLASLNNVTFAPPFPKTSWTDVSPMASIDYQVTPDVMVYGRVSQGFKSGGFNGRANSANQNLPYDPERLTSYEGGLKSTWWDHRVKMNFTVFYNDYTDFQASVGASELIGGIPTPILTVLNAGKLHTSGAELELNVNPIDHLRLDAEIGYLDAKYSVFNDTTFAGGSRAWETPAFSPKWTSRFAGSYEFVLNQHGFLTVSGQAKYRSEMALSVDNANPTTRAHFAGLWQDAYWTYDAQIVWENPDRRYSVGLYGKNLTNTLYKTDAQNFTSVGGIMTAYYGNPETITLTFRYRY
jgi:iron complex outermembrane receptor protein